MRYFYHLTSSLPKQPGSIILAITALLLFWPFHPELQAKDDPKNQKVLLSASELDYPPFAVTRADGTADGFSVELLKAVVEEMGMSISFKVDPWHQLKQELADGLLDVLPLVSHSLERDKIYDFTAPYLKLNGTVFIRKGNKEIRHLTDLKTKQVLVMRGDAAHEYVVREKLTDAIIPTDSYEEAFKLLSSGKHDAVVAQQIVGLQLIKKLQLTDIIPVQQEDIVTLKPSALKLDGFEQKFCFAVPKGNQQLLSTLNEGLAIISLNGTYQTLYEKWFAPILPKPQLTLRGLLKNLIYILVPALLILTLSGVWYLKQLVGQKTRILEQEIRERRRIESELTKSNARYMKAQEIGKIGNWEYDIGAKEYWGSTEAIRIFGFNVDSASYSPEQVEGRIVERAIFHETLHVLIEKAAPCSMEFDIITEQPGIRRTLNSRIELERDESGNPARIQIVIQDITEQKQAEEERKRLQSQLNQSQKMEAIGTLAGGIAHDFNNILGAILGYAELARDDSPDGSLVARDIDQVIVASNRARDLIKQILAFSRQVETQPIPLDPAVIFKETIKLLRSSLPSNIAIVQDLDCDCGLILADSTQLHQLLMNLCTNGAHAMEKTGGTLSISLHKQTLSRNDLATDNQVEPGDYVQLSVSDTGVGIPAEIRERLFDPYFTTKETAQGTGMGLAIVHGIVKGYGGFITFASQLGQGSEFRIFLPVLEQHDIEEIRLVEQLIPVGTERILFIDDELMHAEMGQAMLERLGYSVTVRTDSLEALTTFKNQPDDFDMVITDQTMPGMTGVDLARRMLQIRPQLPIILCTGFSSNISEEMVRFIGIQGFALKPLAQKDISTLIRKVLNENKPSGQ